MIAAFLPSNLLPFLHPPTERSRFMESLSSGQLLCVAYNACVRRSKHPWGYVSKDGVHDIIALEKMAEEDGIEGGRKGWTFRRTDNLRLWAGWVQDPCPHQFKVWCFSLSALKLRYMLPIQIPSQVIQVPGVGTQLNTTTALPSSPVRSTYRSTEPPLLFDAKVVAKKEDGWEDMLESVLLRWVTKALQEKRNIHWVSYDSLVPSLLPWYLSFQISFVFSLGYIYAYYTHNAHRYLFDSH